MYSIEGPWTPEEEDELLRLYRFECVEGLDDVWRFTGPGPRGAEMFSRREALEWVKQVRRTAYGRN